VDRDVPTCWQVPTAHDQNLPSPLTRPGSQRSEQGTPRCRTGPRPCGEKQVVRLEESFDELAHEYLEKHAKVHKRSWHEDQRTLKRELLPRWRRVKAKPITRRHMRRILHGVMELGLSHSGDPHTGAGTEDLQLRHAAGHGGGEPVLRPYSSRTGMSARPGAFIQ